MSLDIYSWIPSLKVDEHLRKNRAFTMTEKYQLIHDALRPLEEKLEALLKLEAESTLCGISKASEITLTEEQGAYYEC